MQMILCGESGRYISSYFIINFDFPFDASEFEKYNNQIKGTFFHEYCHFLQDITTNTGYILFCIELKKFLQHNFPYKFENLQEENDIYSVYKGDINSENNTFIHVNKIEIISDELFKELYPKRDVQQVIISINGNQKLAFGISCIRESMAYLFESIYYNVRERVAEMPYNTAELVAEYYYKEFAKSKLMIMALCEIALMYSNSGVFFVNALIKMHDMRFIPKNTNELEHFIKNSFAMPEVLNHDWILKPLQMVFPSWMNFSEEIRNWIYDRFNAGTSFRKDVSLCFISYTLEQADDIQDLIFGQLLADFGCPPICDSDGYVSYLYDIDNLDVDMIDILTPMAVDSILANNGCPRYYSCKKSKFDSVDDSCKSIPSSDSQSRICSIKQYLYWAKMSPEVITKE